MAPLLTHKKCWTGTHQVAFAFYINHPQWISTKCLNSRLEGQNRALTWTGDTGVGSTWTNGTHLPSQIEWPYLLHGHFNLTDIFTNCLFYAGLHSCIMLAVMCVFSNMLIKLGRGFSGPTVHLKLEGLSWLCVLDYRYLHDKRPIH